MASKAQANEFLKMIVPIAQRQAKKHNNQIYASVCIAQAIHESGWGTCSRMAKSNALFGIKVGKSAWKFGTAWKGAAYKSGTTEYYDGVNPTKIVDYFRAYDSVEDATEDYFDLLCTAKRYKGALNQPTPEKCIQGIIAGGYATGPSYVNAIVNLLNSTSYNLKQYDVEGSTVSNNPIEQPKSNITTVGVKNKPVLRLHSKGDWVKVAQARLVVNGIDVKVDGIFGPKTKAAVEEFQSIYGLVVDGIIGPKTWAKLYPGV